MKLNIKKIIPKGEGVKIFLLYIPLFIMNVIIISALIYLFSPIIKDFEIFSLTPIKKYFPIFLIILIGLINFKKKIV